MHLLRNSFRYASRKDWTQIARDLKGDLHRADRGRRAGSVRRVRGRVGGPLPRDRAALGIGVGRVRPVPRVPRRGPSRDLQTNSIESINARIRKAVKARGHFPTETAALKCVYLAVMSLDPTGRGRQRWTNRWKPALNAFIVAFRGRILPTGK